MRTWYRTQAALMWLVILASCLGAVRAGYWWSIPVVAPLGFFAAHAVLFAMNTLLADFVDGYYESFCREYDRYGKGE